MGRGVGSVSSVSGQFLPAVVNAEFRGNAISVQSSGFCLLSLEFGHFSAPKALGKLAAGGAKRNPRYRQPKELRPGRDAGHSLEKGDFSGRVSTVARFPRV